jgi:UDP-N-acetylmuramate--alanine ligase
MYRKKTHIHFVGIGGIGMSGIATILAHQGYTISGCDSDPDQKSLTALKQCCCSIYTGNDTPDCHDPSIDVLVYSSAIHANSPEIEAAKKRGIPVIPRAAMLAELMRTKYGIGIAGSHGKTTTTSMISHILIEAHKDPTVIIGGVLQNISTHARLGKGEFLVAESDESDRSFLRLTPTLAVVTNIDREHLDVYRDLEDIKTTFIQFLNNMPFYGKAVVCIDDENVRSILPSINTAVLTYGTTQDAHIQARDIILNKDHTICTIWQHGTSAPLGTLTITMPGMHNMLNALAATAIALELDIPFHVISQALEHFKGIDRRFSLRGTYHTASVFDDYGHHPTEVHQILKVARKQAAGKLVMIFQPHRYTRTQKLWQEFLDLFITNSVDELIITDIYPASEEPIPTVTSQRFVYELQQLLPQQSIHYIPYEKNFNSLITSLESINQKKPFTNQDIIILQGAGPIYKLAPIITQS